MCDSSDMEINFKKDCLKIDTTVALFKNLSTENPVSGSVIYFWESHTDNIEDEENVKATEDLIYKLVDLAGCEKYEVRTGYLSRYNYLNKPWTEASAEEMKEAVVKGLEQEEKWLKRCNPNLTNFINSTI